MDEYLNDRAPHRVARCTIAQRTQDPKTGVWSEWGICGKGPALVDPEGEHLCDACFLHWWHCILCGERRAVGNALEWHERYGGLVCPECPPPTQEEVESWWAWDEC